MNREIKISNLEIEKLENPGCNNGNYSAWQGIDESGKVIGGITCRCLNGCSNTDRLENYTGNTATLVILDENENNN